MCGIGGIVTREPRAELLEYAKTISDSLRHRGPDDEGYLILSSEGISQLTGQDTPEQVKEFLTSLEVFSTADIRQFKLVNKPKLVLVHRRLAILDPTPRGHQPMSYSNGAYWITYNGEIYNYLELASELQSTGYKFSSRTDTEVILAAYDRYHYEFLGKLNGMWAMALLDLKRGKLILVRDRFGVKPLYYYYDGEYFAFASELKALLKLPFIPHKLNLKVGVPYLILGNMPSQGDTFLLNVKSLKPAHMLEYDLREHSLKIWQYYRLNYNDSWEPIRPDRLENHARKISELIEKAIRLRLRADVEIGGCLSGGLDSSTILCVVRKLEPKLDIKAFTATFQGEAIDESRWAKLVAESIGVQWYRTSPEPEDLLTDLHDLIYYQDEPFPSTSIYAQYKVMELANLNGVKVVLDGQGGDELFGGYIAYWRGLFTELILRRDFKRLLRELSHLKNSPLNFKGLLWQLLLNFSAGLPVSAKLSIITHKYWLSRYLTGDALREFREALESSSGKFSLNKVIVSLNSQLHMHFIEDSLPHLLRYEDRNSMRFSIESRVPFSDDIELIEYTFSIPGSYKIVEGWSKALLRKAVENLVPRSSLERCDKIGFETPEVKWLNYMIQKLDLLEFRSPILDTIMNFDNFYRDMSFIPKILRTREDWRQIWRLLNLSIWLQLFNITV